MRNQKRQACAWTHAAAFAGVGAAAAVVAPSQGFAAEGATESSRVGWYIGAGLGAGFGAKYDINGRTVSFDDHVAGATDKSPVIAINFINAGATLGPRTLIGFSGSAAAKRGTKTGGDVGVQVSNYFAAITFFPEEQGFFVRGGGGVSSIVLTDPAGDVTETGYGLLAGAGYALRLKGRHSLTFTLDHSWQFYCLSHRCLASKPTDSQFTAFYLGYMFRR